MKSLFITSIENFSGKTAVTLGLGRRMQIEGRTVGYVKPISYAATVYEGHALDEDVTFVRNVLGLQEPPEQLSTLVVTPETLDDCLSEEGCDFTDQIMQAVQQAGEGKDLLLIEGGGSLRQGYVLGLSTGYLADLVDSQVLVVIKSRGQLRLLDDALTAQYRLDERLLGIVINRVEDNEMDFVMQRARPYLEARGVPVLGVLPARPNLAALSVAEVIETLDAKVLTGEEHTGRLAEELVIVAMGAREALHRFRQYRNKAVITGGDRTDLQLAARETSTAALVLTGNLTPNASVLERAAAQDVPVLLVPTSTMDTIERIEDLHGKTRLGQAEKLAHFESLMAENVDFKRLNSLLGFE
ncbi:MAG: phosphotransacetylase family protein [Anaerolineae bacterium]